MERHIGLDSAKVREALEGLSTRDLEHIRVLIERRLRTCVLCGADGAVAVRCSIKEPTSGTFALLICPPCIEKHRLPEARST